MAISGWLAADTRKIFLHLRLTEAWLLKMRHSQFSAPPTLGDAGPVNHFSTLVYEVGGCEADLFEAAFEVVSAAGSEFDTPKGLFALALPFLGLKKPFLAR